MADKLSSDIIRRASAVSSYSALPPLAYHLHSCRVSWVGQVYITAQPRTEFWFR